jgi:hypothetical protein
MPNGLLGLPFAAIALVFIALWLMLNFGGGDEPYQFRGKKIVGNIFAVLGVASLLMQILQWSKVI